MTDQLIATAAWIALALHVAAGIAAVRSGTGRPWLPLLNLTIAGCVVAYWASRWYGYLFHGVTWDASDQLIPLYALLVCALSVLSLSGRYHVDALDWAAFAVDGVVAIGAVLFMTFFKMRLF